MSSFRYRHRRPPRFDDEPIAEAEAVDGATEEGGDGQVQAPMVFMPVADWDPLETPWEHEATQTAPKRQRAMDDRPTFPEVTRFHWIFLAGILVLGLLLRLRDPLATSVIAAEDPYRHMERTWDLVQGIGVSDYPPGLMVLMAPFALVGSDAFAAAARFLPPLFGALLPAAMFFLAKDRIHPGGALASAAAVAVMPETIRRTNILFPTTLDLVLFPVAFLLLLRASEGDRGSLLFAGAIALVMVVTHPWALVLLLPVALVFWVVKAMRRPQARVAARAGAAGIAAVALLLFGFITPSGAASRISEHALPRLREIVVEPSSLAPLPPFVDFPGMLTIPVLLLAAGGTVVAFRRRDAFSLLAVLATFLLLPLTLVDWFGLWFVPHRTIAYLAIGAAMLVGLVVSEALQHVDGLAPAARAPATSVAVVALLILTIPAALTMEPWYRLHGEEDQEGWQQISADDPSLLVAGSWQGRSGYRAMTGEPATFDPGFFRDEGWRDRVVKDNPGIVVMVDQHTHDEGLPTGFLDEWEHIGTWGETEAYRPPVDSSS